MKAFKVGQESLRLPIWAKQIKEIVNKIEDADVLIIDSDEDLNPSLYMDYTLHPYTLKERMDTISDSYETALIRKAIKLDIPIVAINKGALMACIEAGGAVIQYANNHRNIHTITTLVGDIKIGSKHIAMMDLSWLPSSKYSLLGYSKVSNNYRKGNENPYFNKKETRESFREPEIVYFKEIGCLAIQCDVPVVGSMDTYFEYLKTCLDNMLLIESKKDLYERKVRNMH